MTDKQSGASRWMKRLEKALLPEQRGLGLALLRILIFGFTYYRLVEWRDNFQRVAEAESNIFRPVGVASMLTQPLDPGTHALIYQAAVIACAFAMVGALYRFSGPLAGALVLFVLTYRQSWGFIYHTENLMVVHTLVLAFSPAADTVSIDEWIWDGWKKKRLLRFLRPFEDPEKRNWKYGFPIQLMILLTGVAYWVAGMAKLGRGGGLNWAIDAHLLGHIGNNALRYHFLNGGAKEITYELYSWPPWLFVVLSFISLAVELCAPLSVLHPVLAVLIAFALYCFHKGIYVVMGIPFQYQLTGVAFLPFLPWDWMIEKLSRWFPSKESNEVTGSQ